MFHAFNCFSDGMRVGPVLSFQCCGVPSGKFFSPTLKKDCHIAFPMLFACGEMDDFTVMATKIFTWQLSGLTGAWETRHLL